jgi:phosphatidylserine/phosphatidylglycerophosphate/cardiolipin synthase-like enzyme
MRLLYGSLLPWLPLLLLTSAEGSARAASYPGDGIYLNSNGSPILNLIPAAQTSIDIEIYTMEDPTVRSLLRNALSRGVKVRVLKDPNPDGSNCNVFLAPGDSSTKSVDNTADCKDQRQFVVDVQNAGGTYLPFDKKTLCPNGGGADGSSCYEHGKILIADSQVALISTGNFDDTNLCISSESETQCDRDYSMIESDPTLVSALEAIYAADLKGASYDVASLIPSSLAQTLVVSPDSLQPLLDFINSAQTSIDIETQYLEQKDINSALEAAAKRGVKVSVTTASACAFGKPSSSDSKSITTTYDAFDKAGISSSMFNSSNEINGKSGYLHAKAIVVDGSRAWMGSQNGSNQSLTENREYGIFFDTPADVSFLLSQIQSDHDSPDSETWQQALTCTKDK